MTQTLEDLDFTAEYDATTEAYRASLGSAVDTPPTWAIIALASIVNQTDPLDMAPLYEVIDPDSLETLFRTASTGCRIEFMYAGLDVSLTSDGELVVSRSESAN